MIGLSKSSKKSKNMRIAIVGPDGPGKTSISNQLQQMLPKAQIIYAGKSHNQTFRLTKWTYQFWKWIKQLRLPIFLQLVLFLIYYPIEFLENLAHFRKPRKGKFFIYDRHPIDRMIMIHEYQISQPTHHKWSLKYLLLRRYNWFYQPFFPNIEQICCLLPKPELCWQCADGHYRSPVEAQWKIESYRLVATELAKHQKVQIIEIKPELTINAITQNILVEMGNI